MNYIFGEDESEKSNIDAFGCSDMLENFKSNNKESESLNNYNRELNSLGQMQYELTNNVCKNEIKYESVSEIANFGEDDSDSISSQDSIYLLDQAESTTKFMHFGHAEHSQNDIAKSIFDNEDSYLIENIGTTKESMLDLELSSERPNILNINNQHNKDANETVEQTFSNSTQLESHTKKRNRMCGYYRWNRKDDTKMFNELRKACKQSNIDPEDFYDNNYFISNQHQEILNTLVDKLQWRRDAETLLNRIRTLSKTQNLSGRQLKTLKKCINHARAKNEELKVESIADMFPGKSTANLKRYINKISRSMLT